ncbi:aldo/keto reductase [Microbacterium sp. B19]|uniref:aldo/keto reductase n=1 Tax=Microbacterium sp. B19 TaxID=96765 RepID=UPI00034B2810|nr:aldo/keto reductase [Microbacterium sp. B19]
MSDDPVPSAALGLGLAAVGRPAYITAGRDHDLGDPADRSIEAMRARSHDLLDAAWDLGIRYVDVARSYGYAEAFLGDWLRLNPARAAHLTVGSKWGYAYVGGWRMDAEVHERKEHSVGTFRRQWPETVAALGRAPDIYLIHSVTPDSPALGDAELLDDLRALAETGVRVGLSTSGPHQGAVLDAARVLPGSPFSVVQATWNLRESTVGPALARAHDEGWTVVVKEALANGELATFAPGEAADVPADVFALGAARGQRGVDIVLSGASTRDQLRRGVDSPARPVDDATRQRFAVDAETYWRRRSERPWR